MSTINPWEVHSIEAFLFLKCPECRFDTQEEEVFRDHAIENHSLSYILFGKEVKQEQFDEFENSTQENRNFIMHYAIFEGLCFV